MHARRASRERLLQALYQSRISGEWSLQSPLPLALPAASDDEESGQGDAEAREDAAFAARVTETLDHRRDEIDILIEDASRNWRIDRMSAVDVSVLRLAAAELLLGTAPARVVINEAVELAKKFGADSSSTFVNGVLDGMLRALSPAT